MKHLPIDEHQAEFLEGVAVAAVIESAAKLGALDAVRQPSAYPAARARLVVAGRGLAQLVATSCEPSGLPSDEPQLPQDDDPYCVHGRRFSQTCERCDENNTVRPLLLPVAEEGKPEDWRED
jgi:hypothetical protein